SFEIDVMVRIEKPQRAASNPRAVRSSRDVDGIYQKLATSSVYSTLTTSKALEELSRWLDAPSRTRASLRTSLQLGVDGIRRELSTSWMRRGRGVNLQRRPRIRASAVHGRDVVASSACGGEDRRSAQAHPSTAEPWWCMREQGRSKKRAGEDAKRRDLQWMRPSIHAFELAPLNHILHTRCMYLSISQHTVTEIEGRLTRL
ncbi:hypothetical protein SCHPADRAFT_897524, partial [Schizopora paradoxa]